MCRRFSYTKDTGLVKYIFDILTGPSSCTSTRYISSRGYVVVIDDLILRMHGSEWPIGFNSLS